MNFHVENFDAIGRLQLRLAKLKNPDATPLMASWTQIITDDNREGVLAGLDKDGNPMVPVTYRPKGTVTKLTSAQRLGQRANRKRDLLFGGIGPHASGLHNNLSSSEYRRLDGPPLAPRRQFSRVITNLRTAWEPLVPDGTGRWVAFGYWEEVVSRSGFSFLPVHFNGEPLGRNGPSIKRDLRGVRPAGREKAKLSARAWALDLIRTMGA